MPEQTFSEITQKIHSLKLQIKDLQKKIVIHEVLPKEIFVKILKKICYKSINLARGTCTHWKNVIDSFNLVEETWGKNFQDFFSLEMSYSKRFFHFSQDICINSIKSME